LIEDSEIMDMTGEYRIAAPRSQVWAALNDPLILKQCIPGCELLEKTSDTEMNGKVTAKVGPVTARFGGKVTLSDLDPPNSYKISGEGTGGPAGFAKGGAAVALKDDGDGTLLTYKVNANVGGKLAQIGSRLIDGTARKMAEEFFAKFASIVAANAAAAPTPAAPVTAAAPVVAAAPEIAPEPTPAPVVTPELVVTPTPVSVAPIVAPTAPVPTPAPTAAPSPVPLAKSGMSPAMLWGAVVVVVVLAALYFIAR
jgi:carbon monoxide dehydrogenase subunit G